MTNFELLRDLLKKDRSIRRFDASRSISRDLMEQLVDLTRYCASGRNLQPLRYRIVTESRELADVFPALAWAGYYTDWDGPIPEERPTAYLIQCIDTELAKDCLCDDGLHLQAITLGATAEGLGCCIIKSFNRKTICEALNIPERFQPIYVLALGYPVEKAKIVDLKSDGDYKYYRDPDRTQCVPKRSLSELIITRT